jgi:putative transposase
MPIRKELIDELMKEAGEGVDIFGENGLLDQLKKAVVERALEAEMTHHLGYDRGAPEGRNGENSRNGHTHKTIIGKDGPVEIATPRDRDGSFDPKIVRKRQKRINGFDDTVISLYGRGMTTREIRAHLREIYGTDVSPELISAVTGEVLEEVRAWQGRPLSELYPILYLDALFVTTKEGGPARRKAVNIVVGVGLDGLKQVLGIWISETEGAKFWLSVLTDLKNRGVREVLIACVDGLTGFPEAIRAAYPHALVQRCIVHQIRTSLAFVSYADRKAVAASLKPIYRAGTEDQALAALEEFAARWDGRYPMIAKSWRSNWSELATFFAFPEDIRRAIYTTNAIESMNYSLRKILKNRSLFPNDEAVEKLVYLALRNLEKKWTMPMKGWKAALNQFAILFEERFPSSVERALTHFV